MARQGEELTCRELIDFLWAYEDGELPAGEREAFDAHLAICPDCVTYLETYRTVAQLGAEAFERRDADVSPLDLPEALVQAILAARR